MSLHELPRMDAAHVDGNGDILFFTPDGREGVITELGSTLVRSTRIISSGSELSTELELPFDEYVEPAERPMPMTAAQEVEFWSGSAYKNPDRSAGRVSKERK